MAGLQKGYSMNSNGSIDIDVVDLSWFVFKYQRVGHISLFSALGFDVYCRVGKIFSVFGIVFNVEK